MVASIHFAGEIVGMMSLHVTWEFGRIISAAMLGMEEEKITGNEEIKDVVGEIANIVAGNLKTDFMDAGLSLVLSTPSITRGNDFKIDPPDIAEPQYLKFVHHDQELNIDVYLKEDKGANLRGHRGTALKDDRESFFSKGYRDRDWSSWSCRKKKPDGTPLSESSCC